MDATVPDLLRLLAVPAFLWAGIQDVRTRRVPNRTWLPLLGLGVLLVGWDLLVLGPGSPGFGLYLLRLGLSVGLVGGLALGFWIVGGFGGADAKAFLTLAVLFPTYPAYEAFDLTLPLVETTIGVFSLTVLTNAVLIGAAYPLALAVSNLRGGTLSPLSLVAREVSVRSLPDRHGTLLDTDGGVTRSGLDLDALRMYLRWRRIDLATLRTTPELVDPATLPEEPGDPTDGAVGVGTAATDPSLPCASETTEESADRWGAEAFLDALDGSAYGTSPEDLRAGLDRIVAADRVWVSPGIPFIVPTVLGLILALIAGDLLFWVLDLLGLAGP
ncbi:peptidase A24B, FlaK domain protein [Halodesulfurarchaeum formicicum]|uniref:Peptidase A24B, FlaK domain protein n=1 Tax=Halodesulfurarchaeum formicicum TaxID=1873524 RepID=A0A1D8S1P9_9EURY|nr:A24 family peptidase [Halodesulfurarchaeum formicicum]AOW79292.1 peptidase A24B, FlaK domain protein [Halodesulfurarchaeum formicicum]